MNAEYTETVDVAGLVEAGLLDLDVVFERANWRRLNTITRYTACVYGPNGDEPGDVVIDLESAEEHGITAYRWVERDDGGTYERGPITLNQYVAIQDAWERAEACHDALDADDIIRQIVDTGYFGNATAAEIKAVCEEATRHSRGYLLLPAGEFCGHPIDRMWTTDGYLQGRYVRLDATYPDVAYAADALLRAVIASDE